MDTTRRQEIEQVTDALLATFDPGGNLPDDCAEWAEQHTWAMTKAAHLFLTLLAALEVQTQRIAQLEEVMRLILAEPYGCPMCDSGKLRNPAKEHWDCCGFAWAASLLAPPPSKEP
jgi:CelD/BcsL family acetyltransferase involved in cellulose biosynthesis